MNIEYIIVQAGGKGTRLGQLTANKAKALVPVQNLPMIFHLFQKYPDKRFLIIGDYQFDVLEKYLRTFAKSEYLLLRTSGDGNAAGIGEALGYIPEHTPFMLLWSDLMLSEEFHTDELENGCYVGLSGDFLCSWSFEDGILDKHPSVKNGVAGCFLFDEKARLNGLPEAGSFAGWLSQSGLLLHTLDMRHSKEAGTLEAIRRIDPGENRCRPYNHMEFTEDMVIKTGLTEEGRQLIEREAKWYQMVSEYGFDGIPEIFSYQPLKMQRIQGDNIFKANLTLEQKQQTIVTLVESVEKLHAFQQAPADCFALQEDYFNKTLKRVQGIREAIPFADQEFIWINDKKCKNILYFEKDLQQDIRNYLFDTTFGPIHGDCTLTNTLINEEGQIFFIDARGYFGKQPVIGDVYYDWAKLYYSISGNFDNFNIKKFRLQITEKEVHFQIEPMGWEELTEFFLSCIQDCKECSIQLIHAIIWISLASHCWEDFDSMCTAFYNGLYLWNEWEEKYNGRQVI